MALFGGMFGGEKHPKLVQLSQAIQNSLGLQLVPPEGDVLQVIDAMTSHDMIGVTNSRSVEGAQEIFRSKSLRAVVDPEARTLALHVAAPDDIERELQAEHTAVKVMHVGAHHGTSRIIRVFNPATEPVKVMPSSATAAADTSAPSVPPAFEHLEATERLCPVLIDHLVKHGQLTTADKDALKKIKPADYTLEARIAALERWREEVTRRARRIHVAQTTGGSLLNASTELQPAQESEEAALRRFDTLLRWLGKFIKALEHKSIKFHGKPVWLPH